MQFPKTHSNGSTPYHLFNDYVEAAMAVGKAIEMTEKCAPHARDYYVVQETEAMAKASAEHTERIQKLISVNAEFSG